MRSVENFTNYVKLVHIFCKEMIAKLSKKVNINVKKEGQGVRRTRTRDFLGNDLSSGVGLVAVISQFPNYPI